MTSSDQIGAGGSGAVVKKLEFDLFVTEYVGIRSAPGAKFGEHHFDYFIMIGFFKIPNFKRNTQAHCHTFGVREVGCPGTLVPREILGPVFHVDASDVESLVFE